MILNVQICIVYSVVCIGTVNNSPKIWHVLVYVVYNKEKQIVFEAQKALDNSVVLHRSTL